MNLTHAQVARLKAIESKGGHLSAPRVVADAKAKTSPLHPLFDWDRNRAAEKYWLGRAREIIGAVTVEITHQKVTMHVPCYVNLPGTKDRGYQRIEALRNDPAQARESLIYTLDVAAGHLRRAYDISGPLGIADQIDQLLEQVAGVQRIVRQKEAA